MTLISPTIWETIFGNVHRPVGIHVYEVDVLPGLEPGTVPTGSELLAELMLLTGSLTIGIIIGVELEVLPPSATIWRCTSVVPRAFEEAKKSSVGFCMLFQYVKRGLRLSNDSFTASITGSERCKGRLAGSTVWFSIVSISNGARLSIISVDGS